MPLAGSSVVQRTVSCAGIRRLPRPPPPATYSFDVIDPIPVELRDGMLVAAPGYESVGEALLAQRASTRSIV